MITGCMERYHQKISRGGGATPWRIFSQPYLAKSQDVRAIRAWRTPTRIPTTVYLSSARRSLFHNNATVSFPSWYSDLRRQACVFFLFANDQPQQCVRLTTAISASRIPSQRKTQRMDNRKEMMQWKK